MPSNGHRERRLRPIFMKLGRIVQKKLLLQWDKLTRNMFLLSSYLPKVRKTVQNGPKRLKDPTPNNKTFLFQVPET